MQASSFHSHICWKDCHLPVEWSCHYYCKSFGHICKVLCLCSVSLVYRSVFNELSHTVLIVVALSWVLKSRMWVVCFFSGFFFFLDMQSPLRFHMSFRMDFYISAKRPHWYITETVDHFVVQYRHLCNITFLNPWTQDVFGLFLSSLISFNSVLLFSIYKSFVEPWLH